MPRSVFPLAVRSLLLGLILLTVGCAAPAERTDCTPTDRVVDRGAPPPKRPNANADVDVWDAYFRDLTAWLAPAPPDQPQPKLACEQTTVDAGEVWEGSFVNVTWMVRNAGAAPLRLSAMFGGCMRPGGPTTFALAPGERGTLTGRLGACFPLGRHDTCGPHVRSNDRDKPELNLDAVVTVRSAIRTGFDQISTRSFRFEPFPATAGPQTKTIQIRRGDGGPLRLQVKSIRPENAVARLRELEAGERYELAVQFNPPWPTQGRHGEIALATGVDLQPEVKIGFSAEATSPGAASMPAVSAPR